MDGPRRPWFARRWGLALLVWLLALFIGGIYSLGSLARATDWVRHTHESQIALSRFLATLVDAETGLRGYLLTGDRTLLEPYERALSGWRDDLDRLGVLTAGSPEQRRRLEQLGALAMKRLALLAKSRAARETRAVDPDAAVTVLAGRQTMDDLRALIANMETEQGIFDGQQQEAAVRRWRVTMGFYLAGGLLSFIVIGLGLLRRRQAEARRVLAEEAARANELFRSLVENLSEMAWTAGPDGQVDFRNRRWVEYTGLSLEEIERSGASLHDPAVFPEMMRRWQAALVAGEPFEMEYPLRGADGAFRWFLMRVRPLRDRAGRIVRWFGTNTDVTRLKELADELAAERARLQSLISQMPVAVVLFEGEEPRFELTNPAFEQLVRRRAPLPGTPASDIAREIHGQLFLDALAECRRTGEPRAAPEHVATIRGDDGQNEERVFTTSFAALRDQAGRITGVVSATIDVTDQVRARQSLETSIRFAEEFVGIVSHDLRDPLQAISVAAARLKTSGRLSTDDIRPVDMILSGAGRMARMVTQLLDLSHARLKGVIPVNKKVVDISKVFAPIIEELRLVHPDREILWNAESHGMCLCDEDRMAQVASNLVANALEHGGPAGPIRVALTDADDSVALVVHNSGPPIPADLLPTIFDLGSRGLARNKGSKGLGLGLFIAHQIVTAHGGRIDVTSSARDGTAFRVVLPTIVPSRDLENDELSLRA